MHLKTIKLRGFKSFVDPIEVRLEPGVAVVIGPNGSGKSNISDSILWATGSLSPHELRAEKPDDVLFAGSKGRGPVDFCEVELVFDNEDGAWPDLPYAEVSLARRLHRGGEGQYLVNRAPVRRLDLVELLSDVGLGGGLRSIISQGSVESVLSAKPAERRSLIEEAAGLGRFKLRRHRAELKLARVSTQVERARDLEDEVRKRLRPLALQASAAERAEKLRGEVATVHAAIATVDLGRLSERERAALASRQAALAERAAVEESLQGLLDRRSQAEEELTDAAGARETATAALYALRAGTDRVALRREAAESLASRFSGELDTARAYDPTHSEGLASAAREAGAAAQAAASERAGLELQAEERWALVAGAERSQIGALASELDRLSERRGRIENELLPDGRNSLLALRGAVQQLGLRQESLGRLRNDIDRDITQARANAYTGPSPVALGKAADEADAAARVAARERDDLAARARLARERLAGLDRSLAEREGLPPAARAMAESGERLALSFLDVPAGEERAVAAALGRLASAVVTDNANRGLELLRQARDGGLGSLTVLVGHDPREVVASLPVVEPDALLSSKVPSVTREGLGWDPVRGELWFAGETAEAVLLELQARRAELLDEVSELDAAAARAAEAASAADQIARDAALAYKPVAHLRNVRQKDIGALERVARGAERLDEALRASVQVARRVESPLAERAGTAAADLRDVSARESDLRRQIAEIEGRARAAEKQAGGRAHDVSGDPDAFRREAEALAEQVSAARVAATAAAERAAAAARALADANTTSAGRIDVLTLERLTGAAQRLVALLGVDVTRFEAPLRERVEADGARSSALGNELRQLGAEEAQVRTKATEIVARVSALDVEIARVEAETEDARRRLVEADAKPAEGTDRHELVTRLDRLERRLEQLGQVNPLAQEEHDAEKERLDELVEQRADLEQSLDELAKLRRDLTETVERRFDETFTAVQKHFAEVVPTLFPGGEGRLFLSADEDADGEPGIEIELRPAGKRVTRLTLLSGGEKALGAVAFLFSLFLARPSPFYLLDEVEAALDDTNIGRFTSLLRRYADQAQFIVITHQKRTMEAADVLYGVTMAQDGVSKILSRRLPHEEEMAATA